MSDSAAKAVRGGSPETAGVPPVNLAVAKRFEETAALLEAQEANPFRVRAYRQAAATLRGLGRPVDEIVRTEGTPGLDRLPGIGPGLAAAIRDYVESGRMPIQEWFRAQARPLAALRSVPGVGPRLAERLHQELGIETLEELELAAHDGRLARVSGFGPRRIETIKAALAARLGRSRPPTEPAAAVRPPVAELLDVDREYRELAAARRLTPRAHELDRTHDWVVLYWEEDGARGQQTVVTAKLGPLRSRRVVRGREEECAEHYRAAGALVL
jgi:hypothetical protein